jgi:hypothetical protein
MKYHYSKASVLTDVNKDDLIDGKRIFAEDTSDHNGSKRFFILEDLSAIENYVTNLSHTNSHVYEVIPNVDDFPCYLFFDIDRPAARGTQGVLSALDFVKHFKFNLESFLYEKTRTRVALEEGKTMQVKYTPYLPCKNKLSLHVKVNLLCKNLLQVKHLAKEFVEYVRQKADGSIFFYNDVPVIDCRVYSNFRSFRTLYSSKRTTGVVAEPLPGCSNHVVDHLVMWHPGITQTCIDLDLTTHSNTATKQCHRIKKTISDSRLGNPTTINNDVFLSHLERSSILSNLFRVPKIVIQKEQQSIDGSSVCYFIDRSIRVTCPYASRKHKSNRTFLVHDVHDNTVFIKCFDEECIKCPQHLRHQFNLFRDTEKGSLNISKVLKTLHTNQKQIRWNEVYNEPRMRPYPLRPLVCVRANMGACKTEELLKFIKDLPSSDSCLFITYQVVLAEAYATKLAEVGFCSYLADNGGRYLMDQDRLVVCLDSLWKVKQRSFDFFFVDEVLSVLLHFNSSLMRRSSSVSAMFEYMLLAAKHIFFVDACVDNCIVQDVVAYICNRKQLKCDDFYAIWNQHVRPTNRKCHMFVNRESQRQIHTEMQQHICHRIKQAVLRGERAVVASTTKSFTNMLIDSLKDTLVEHGLKWIVHNGDHQESKKQDPTCCWGEVDLLIYSPSIGAGVSFSESHFDCLFAYIENSFYTPTVDFVLQQLFRVRQLKKGEMFLFINDGYLLDEAKSKYPTSSLDIEDWMDANIMCLPDKYCASLSYESGPTVHSVQKRLVYDKSKLSYKILKGIVAAKNVSLQSFTEILINTLRDDYHVACVIEDYKSVGAFEIPSHKSKECQLSKPSHLDLEQINQDVVLSKSEYHTLCRLPPREKSDMDKHLMWIYEATVCMWRIHPSNIDRWFYENCIGWEGSRMKKAKELFARALRWHIASSTSHDMQDVIKMLDVELQSVEGDLNMTLYNKTPLSFYQLIMEGKYVLEHVFGIENMSTLVKSGIVKVELGCITSKLRDYVSVLTSTRFTQLRSMMSMDKRAYPSLEKLRENKGNQHAFIARILDASFGIKFRLAERTAARQVWHMENQWYRDICKKYRPGIFT